MRLSPNVSFTQRSKVNKETTMDNSQVLCSLCTLDVRSIVFRDSPGLANIFQVFMLELQGRPAAIAAGVQPKFQIPNLVDAFHLPTMSFATCHLSPLAVFLLHEPLLHACNEF